MNLSAFKVKTGQDVTAILSCIDPDPQDTIQFSLDWGDGNVSGWTALTSLTHAYGQAGTYNITLTARDGGNLTGQVQTSIQVMKKTISGQKKEFIPGMGMPAVIAVIGCWLVIRSLRRPRAPKLYQYQG